MKFAGMRGLLSWVLGRELGDKGEKKVVVMTHLTGKQDAEGDGEDLCDLH